MTDRASALQPFILAAVVVAAHASLYPGVADLDAFYHIGHALAYLEGTAFDTSLPWATRSIIGETGGDLWWGFHVFSIPFALVGGVEWGIRIGAAVVTATLGFTFMAVLRRHGVVGAGWWAALFLLAVPNVLFRNLMLRPHVLSLAVGMALLSVCVRGRSWQVLLLSAVISWLHLSLFWLGPLVVAVYSLVRVPVTVGLGRDPDDPAVPLRFALPAAIAGAVLGWVARPDALAAASLVRVQLVELFTLKALDLPLTFAGELVPLGALEALRMSGLFALVWLVGVILLVRGGRVAWGDGTTKDRPEGTRAAGRQELATLGWSAVLLSTLFLALALTSARRAMEQWVAFGFLALPFAWSVARTSWKGVSDKRRTAMRAAAVAVLTLHLGWYAWRHALNVSLVAFPASTLAETAAYLETASEPGDVVFHARWDNFGPLFAHNRTNRYLGGMDPVFLYAYDPASYWEFFFLSADATTEWTCDAFPCSEGTATDTHQALTDHFGARWIVIEPTRNPQLALYLLDDARYRLAHDAQRAAVFEVLTPAPEGD
ncbi:MAG: hypothetical protein HKN72_16990 [Gemmatimonadetes bacterium]|nr:hypothetical protein [Gemmatimonadota bacterium]